MSEQNIQILKEGLEAMSSGNIARILRFTHPDFEAVIPAELSAEPDTYRGHDGVRRYFQTFDAMDDVRFEPQRFWDAGEAVVVDMRLTARGKQTSIPVEQRYAQIWTLRDGKATGVRTYVSVREALDAAGLSSAAQDAAQ